jgi:hypothetical protein
LFGEVHRWILAAFSLGLMLVATASAQAASVGVETDPAEYVTSGTALLRGTINTHGQRTIWAFQYGHTTRYGATTKARVIPAGSAVAAVALRIGGLRRHTRYHFRLVSQYGQGSVAYPIFLSFGHDRTLVTRAAGFFGLGPTTLVVYGRYALVSLYCASRATCSGALMLTHTKSGQRKPVLLGRRSVRLRGHRTHSFPLKLSGTALTLLRRSGHRLGATVTVRPRGEEARRATRATLIKHVTLTQ